MGGAEQRGGGVECLGSQCRRGDVRWGEES